MPELPASTQVPRAHGETLTAYRAVHFGAHEAVLGAKTGLGLLCDLGADDAPPPPTGGVRWRRSLKGLGAGLSADHGIDLSRGRHRCCETWASQGQTEADGHHERLR